MRRVAVPALLLLLCPAASDRSAPLRKVRPPQRRRLELPIAFEENAGQTDREAFFLHRGPGYALLLTAGGAVVRTASGPPVRLALLGARTGLAPTGAGELPWRSHYFIGNDPARWRKD